jgi:folate-dependent phosphoribosylglycinamide formyltransferase PurN
MSKKKIMMFADGSSSSLYMYNELKKDFNISAVLIEEEGGSKLKGIEGMIKEVGLIKVFGQILFQLSIPKILVAISQKRIEHINDTPIPPSVINKVVSVDSDDCMGFLKSEKPELIIVNGLRMIPEKVLNCTDATFINSHVGITPKYRGVHGGYWAMASGDKGNCGVTVFLVDAGIDTGGVLFQEVISTNSKDNFVTYPYLQIGEGIQLMKRAISDFFDGNLKEKESLTKESKLWSHPTLWYYIKKRVLKGVK